MTPLLLFLASVAADYLTSILATQRGLNEGNPLLRANPVVIALVSAVAVIGLAEGFRVAGYSGWEPIYYVGAGVHAAASLWNTWLLVKEK